MSAAWKKAVQSILLDLCVKHFGLILKHLMVQMMSHAHMHTPLRKLHIIELIMKIDNDSLLAAIEADALQRIAQAEKQPDVWAAVKPIRKDVSLAQIVAEQETKPLDRDTFFGLAEAIELDEPIEDLLADLTA